MVESKESLELMSECEPRYNVPPRKTYFLGGPYYQKYLQIYDEVKNSLKQAEFVALTTDDWSSRATELYMTITSTHIDDSWTMRNYILHTRALPESHTDCDILKKHLMALSTVQAPVYGGTSLTIKFPEDRALPIEGKFYIVYEGSVQRHVTTAQLDAPNKLCSVVPGHSLEEQVQLSAISFNGDEKTLLVTSPFHFHNDGAFYLSQYLIESVYNPTALDSLELVKTDSFDLANEDVSTLDQRLSRALAQSEFPEFWSVLGADDGKEDPEPRETLLHFCARLGLLHTAVLFLRKRGSQSTLQLANKNGDLPKDIAIANNHYKLKDLFSYFNPQGLFPLDQLFEMENGVVQMRDTGDVTLTSSVLTHHRTIDETDINENADDPMIDAGELKDDEGVSKTIKSENCCIYEDDIIVLQGVQKQLADNQTDPTKLWQAIWPQDTGIITEKADNPETASDEKYQEICDKVKEIPNILSEDGECIDTNILEKDIESNTNGRYASDDVEFSDDCDNAMETDLLPGQPVSEDEEMGDIMDENISKLHGYTEKLMRIREKGTVFNPILEQDLRKENLAKFSSSCPSLDVGCRNSPLPVIDEADHHRSMVDLAEDNEQNIDASNVPSSHYSAGELYSSGPDIQDSSDDVRVIVEGATVGSTSSDFGLQSAEYDQFLNEYYGGNIPQVRRRSYSPKIVKPEDPEESNRFFSPSTLVHGPKSANKLPSEGEDTDDDVYRDRITSEDVSMSDSNISADSQGYKGMVYSQEDLYKDNEASINDGDSPDVKNGSTRGPGNPARYSADIEYMVRQMKEHHSGSSLDKMASSSARQSREEAAGMDLSHGKITKALSTSSIPAATNAEKSRGSGLKGLSQDSKHAQFRRQEEIEEEDFALAAGDSTELKQPTVSRIPRKNKQLSLIDFLNDPSNFSNDAGPQSPKVKDKDKDEKKRKLNMFSRLHSSYRIKKNKDKEGKSKSTHRFVSISFSNNTTCDMCHKPLTNKPALRCEICLVNVHENSCKDQITPCDKYKPKSHPPRQSSAEGEAAVMGQDKIQPVGVLRPAFSFKEKSARPQSAYVGAPSQPIPVIQPEAQQLQSASAQLNRRSLPTPRILIDTSCLDDLKSMSPQHDHKKSRSPTLCLDNHKKSRSPVRNHDNTKSKSPTRHSEKQKKGKNVFTSPNTGTYLQWRRASAVAVDRPIAEEAEIQSATRLDLGHSNITEAISQSIESLDEVDSVQEVRFEDVELGNLMTEEPETWSETMDKKVLKKWNQKEVRRQDTIWELIQTERQYCKRLKTLQIFFRDGMLRELNINSAWVERMFPHLDDLIFIHLNFLRELQDLQNKKQDRSVEILGPTLNKQFSGESAKQMKRSYGIFCSGHLEAVQLYKDFVSKDRKFQAFIKQRMNLPMCKKREIPDYILLITQRPTKYPTLIEAVIKSTKDKKDRESLLSALELSKEVLHNVNETVAAAERQMRLKEIYSRMDTRSFAIHKGKKFKKSDILANGRKLMYEGLCGYKNARGKTVEVLAVLLNDVFFFLQDNNQRYSFFAQDNKNGVVSLFNLLVREKRDTRDSKGMYIISQSKISPEMYEVIFSSTLEMQRWAQVMRTAAERCPAEEDEADPGAEEERRLLEKQAKAQAIMDKLSAKDVEIKKCCDEKNRLMMDLIAVYNDTEDQHSRPSSRDFEESPVEDKASTRSSILQAALQEVSNAASQLTTMLQGNGTNLSRSVSSVGEHASHTFTAIPIPKRAETFAGFDTTHDNLRAKKKGPGLDTSDYTDLSVVDSQDNSQSDLSTDAEAPPPIPQRMPFDNEADSDRGSSISSMSVSTLSPASAIYNSQEQSNIASLVRTLNSIVHLTAQQSTAVETLRCQLAEANERINKLSVDVHEKKSGYKHNQLEELRNLQGVIQKEKEEWELKKERENSFMEMERNELEEMRKQLEKQEADIKQQKEELNKKREVLQKQMDLLRQSGQLPNPDRSGSSSDLQSDFVKGHRRSASAEAFPAKNDQASDTGGTSLAPKESFRSEQRPSVTKLQSFSFGSSKQTMPEHLLSAKNEQKMGMKNVQQLPSKLLSGGLSETPPKLSGSLPPNYSPEQGQGGANVTVSGVHGNNSTPSFPQEQVGRGDTNLGHSSSAGVLSSQSNQHGSAVVVSAGNRQSNRPKQSGLAGLTGVMKLAEKGDKKSGKSSSSSQSGSLSNSEKSEQSDKRPKSGTSEQKNPNINHKPQKSDSEVIYF